MTEPEAVPSPPVTLIPTSPVPARVPPVAPPDEGARRIAPEPPFRRPQLRAGIVAVLATMLLLGVGFNVVASLGVAGVSPGSAQGPFLKNPNGTLEVSRLLGVNITSPELFWLRPSATDYQPFLGAGDNGFYGPTDPALLNETAAYAAELGLTNVTVPVDLVTPSASGLGADVTPQAALVQIPRVANMSGLNQSVLLTLVNQEIVPPLFSWLGTPYVNVVLLDLALLPLLPHPPAPLPGGR